VAANTGECPPEKHISLSLALELFSKGGKTKVRGEERLWGGTVKSRLGCGVPSYVVPTVLVVYQGGGRGGCDKWVERAKTTAGQGGLKPSWKMG